MSSRRKVRCGGIDEPRLGSDGEWSEFRHELQGRPLRLTIAAYALHEALEPGDTLAACTFELLAAAAQSARHGGTLECFGCQLRWTEARALVAVGLVELIGDEDACLFGMCPDCWDSPSPAVLMAEAFRREFGLGELAMQSTAPGGQA